MKKYELGQKHPTKNLWRIVAVKTFSAVQVGDLGGYVESERNLSQDGDAWVSGDAQVYGNAHVFGNAQVFGDARVYDSARVFGNAQVFGSAWVYGNAQVFDRAYVYGNAHVFGNAQVSKTVMVIQGKLRHSITITETHIFIGCEGHPIDYWRKNIKKIGRKHKYTDQEIKKVITLIKGALM